jgi:hypothetical protein
MPGLVPGIHVLLTCGPKDVDGRGKPGHDERVLLPRPPSLHFESSRPPPSGRPHRIQKLPDLELEAVGV